MSETASVAEPVDAAERRPIRIDSVDVQRAPGFESRSLSLADLSPGVNVVCGGNAAGKTTLSNAIRWSLWPDADAVPDGARIRTKLTYDDEDRAVVLNGGVTQHLRDGADASPVPVPSLADGDQYELSLEELLQPESDGETFADAIRRESTGGFDVGAVREELGLDGGTSPSTRGISETQAAQAAVEEVERRRREATDLSGRQTELRRVEEKLRDARTARDRKQLLEDAVALAEAREAYREADERVAAFPEALSAFDGGEIETLEALRGEIAEREGAVWDAATTDRDAAAKMAETGLDEPIPESELTTLREIRDRLDELASDRDRLERELERATTERDEAREKIPLDLDDDTLRAVETDELDDLRGFLTAVAVAESAETAQSRVTEAFESVTEPDTVADRDTLVSGRDALAAWLAEPDPADDDPDDGAAETADGARLRRVAVAGGLAVAAGGVAVGLTGNLLGFALALVGVAQAVYAWTAGDGADDGDGGDGQSAVDPRETHREQFPGEALASPEAWTREAVTRRLSEIRAALATVETAETAAETRDRLHAEFDESDAADRVAETRARLRESLGVEAGEGGGAGSDDDADGLGEIELGVAVERIERWQAADGAVSATRSELERARDQLDTERSTFRDRVEQYETDGHEYTVETAANAAGVIESLETRTETYERASERRSGVAGAVAAARRKLDDARDSYESLFTERGLAVGDEDRLQELAEQYEAYTDAVAARDEAETKREQRREDLEAHEAYDPDEGLADCDREELMAELSKVESRADAHDELFEQKKDLENEIESAKGATDVEEAVDERDEALASLAERFDADAGDAVADELLAAVAEETTAARQEPVFRRADELLREITNGAFELRLEDDTFRAYDTAEGRRVDLGDLSTGTQVQVLLSVRVAFVEHRESDTAPPLLLDDTLAVFDDLRAEAVIETVIGLARQGRQVFYFTAGSHERERLRERLRQADVAHEIHHLDGVYDDNPTAQQPQVDTEAETVDVPAPAGDDHDAYRERLDVPTFDPRRGAETAHLWYVTEEPSVLHDLLSVRIDRWGQLNSLLERGLVGGLLSSAARERIRRNGAALAAFTEAYTVGRGDPVDRTVLEDSGAVTENFIDEVSDLAERVDGDPERLLDDLPDVKRFRSDKVRELREYLREEGYLDPRDTRPDEEIRLAVADAYADHGLSGAAADEAAARLLERVGGTEVASDAR